MAPRDLRHCCQLGERSEQLLKLAMGRLGLSARAYHRIIKIARTIADLAGEHLLGAAVAAFAEELADADDGVDG